MRTVNPRFMTHPQEFWEVPVDGFRDVVETNLVGYFLVAREVTRGCWPTAAVASSTSR